MATEIMTSGPRASRGAHTRAPCEVTAGPRASRAHKPPQKPPPKSPPTSRGVTTSSIYTLTSTGPCHVAPALLHDDIAIHVSRQHLFSALFSAFFCHHFALNSFHNRTPRAHAYILCSLVLGRSPLPLPAPIAAACPSHLLVCTHAPIGIPPLPKRFSRLHRLHRPLMPVHFHKLYLPSPDSPIPTHIPTNIPSDICTLPFPVYFP